MSARSRQDARIRKCARQTIPKELQLPQVGEGPGTTPDVWYCACSGHDTSGLCKFQQHSQVLLSMDAFSVLPTLELCILC